MEPKKFEELLLQDDFMFGVIMRIPKYCKTFLETILGIRIARVEYPEDQKTIDMTAKSKSVRLDVYVEDEKETIYNIEMQTAKKKNLPKRSRYYQGMIDLNLIDKGEDYDTLKKSFVIFVCTFDMFHKGRHIYTFENRCLEEPDLSLGDETTKIFLNTKGIMDDINDKVKNLLCYIDGEEPRDAYTKELDAQVRKVRENEKWRRDYMTLLMRDKEKYNEGLEQGLEQGLECGLKALVKSLKPYLQDFASLYQAVIQNPAYENLTEEEVRKYY